MDSITKASVKINAGDSLCGINRPRGFSSILVHTWSNIAVGPRAPLLNKSMQKKGIIEGIIIVNSV